MLSRIREVILSSHFLYCLSKSCLTLNPPSFTPTLISFFPDRRNNVSMRRTIFRRPSASEPLVVSCLRLFFFSAYYFEVVKRFLLSLTLPRIYARSKKRRIPYCRKLFLRAESTRSLITNKIVLKPFSESACEKIFF